MFQTNVARRLAEGMRMLPALATAKPPERKLDTLRAVVHDLRNLFAVVSSAKSLLDRPLIERTKAILVDASEGVP